MPATLQTHTFQAARLFAEPGHGSRATCVACGCPPWHRSHSGPAFLQGVYVACVYILIIDSFAQCPCRCMLCCRC